MCFFCVYVSTSVCCVSLVHMRLCDCGQALICVAIVNSCFELFMIDAQICASSSAQFVLCVSCLVAVSTVVELVSRFPGGLCMTHGDWSGPLPRYVLCQDCLAVLAFTVARHQEAELCFCGGQLCGCPDCDHEAQRRVACRLCPAPSEAD